MVQNSAVSRTFIRSHPCALSLMYQYGNTDVLQIKALLGHENLATTEIYTHLNDNQVRQAVDANPLNKFNFGIDDDEDEEE